MATATATAMAIVAQIMKGILGAIACPERNDNGDGDGDGDGDANLDKRKICYFTP